MKLFRYLKSFGATFYELGQFLLHGLVDKGSVGILPLMSAFHGPKEFPLNLNMACVVLSVAGGQAFIDVTRQLCLSTQGAFHTG